MFEPIYKRGCRKSHGARVFTYLVTLPDLKEFPSISKFYADIVSPVIRYCEGEFGANAEKRYLTLDERQRQTLFRPTVYSLTAEVTYFDGEFMFIKLTATLRDMDNSVTKKMIEAHAWSTKDQMLIPPRQAARKFISAVPLPRMLGDDGFLVENERYYLCRGGQLSEINIKNKDNKKLKKKG